MSDISQEIADALLAMRKYNPSQEPIQSPPPNGKIVVPLRAHKRGEEFLLDIHQSRISLKQSYNHRARQTLCLARLDLNPRPHTNPDGTVIPGSHLHIYKEGFGIKWAIVPPKDLFSDLKTIEQAFDSFLKYCNIDGCQIQGGLFE